MIASDSGTLGLMRLGTDERDKVEAWDRDLRGLTGPITHALTALAQRFGVSDSDMNQVAGWLQAQGLAVVSTARARNWIAVSGTAAQVENAFQIQLHQLKIRLV